VHRGYELLSYAGDSLVGIAGNVAICLLDDGTFA
jgi:hypothetical protein